MVAPGSQAEQVGRLVLAVVLVLFLPSLPFGTYLIYPFVILTTWFHEMGHGLSALLMGEEFVRLMIFADGSGVAESTRDPDASVIESAIIAAGGPLGPTLAGAALIVASAHRRAWRPALWLTACTILASVIIWVRSPVGYAVLPLVGAGLALIAWKASDGLARFMLQFLGMLGAMSMLADFNYLFTEEVTLGGETMLSDTGNIERALLLPHWVWAAVILIISATTVGASLKYALSDKRRVPPPAKKRPANVLQFKKRP
ncbi:MAG: M50 family metallopeptidase [Erythrobacter sp.]